MFVWVHVCWHSNIKCVACVAVIVGCISVGLDPLFIHWVASNGSFRRPHFTNCFKHGSIKCISYLLCFHITINICLIFFVWDMGCFVLVECLYRAVSNPVVDWHEFCLVATVYRWMSSLIMVLKSFWAGVSIFSLWSRVLEERIRLLELYFTYACMYV